MNRRFDLKVIVLTLGAGTTIRIVIPRQEVNDAG